jgi:uncharacterized OB-fold protein
MSEPVKSIRTPLHLEYHYTAGRASSRFLRGVAQGRILGQRCPECGKVYVPPRGSCPRCGVETDEEVAVAEKGTVTTFSIVRIPTENLSFDPPYVCAHILLDGADIPFFHVLQNCPLDDVRMGMRVRAVWAPREELEPTMRSIRYFEPIDEPDADYDSYKEHL